MEGPTNAQARLRLFGRSEEEVRVVLYRDHHAWCPYCQKVWLWLEEQQVPYRIEKVTMFCYGEKEAWFKRLVPSGMLPALAIDGQLITESDRILLVLEAAFGPLGLPSSIPACWSCASWSVISFGRGAPGFVIPAMKPKASSCLKPKCSG